MSFHQLYYYLRSMLILRFGSPEIDLWVSFIRSTSTWIVIKNLFLHEYLQFHYKYFQALFYYYFMIFSSRLWYSAIMHAIAEIEYFIFCYVDFTLRQAFLEFPFTAWWKNFSRFHLLSLGSSLHWSIQVLLRSLSHAKLPAEAFDKL